MRRHEIPTHLNVPDRFLAGLTAKQVMQLIAAASGAYGLLDTPALPFEARVTLAVLALVVGGLAALVRPGGRALEEWVLLLAYHLATPRQLVWRPCAVATPDAEGGWTLLPARVHWLEPEAVGRGGAAHVR